MVHEHREQSPHYGIWLMPLLEFVCDMYELDWSSGYGGEKYHTSCKNALNLLSKVKSFMDKPTKTHFKSMDKLMLT